MRRLARRCDGIVESAKDTRGMINSPVYVIL